MTEEFEGRDLSGAVFWGVDLSRARLRDVDLTGADLARRVEVLENGTATVGDCVFAVFEEHFQHLRYATRDLDHLG